MKQTAILSLVILMFSVAVQAKDRQTTANKPVLVEIDFGGKHELKRVSFETERTLTALEALQKVAEVKTHPVGSLVFVTEIDKVEAERGKMAWYYKVNGKKPKLAIEQPVNPGDTVSWRFVQDVCSWKVDGTPKP
jgi:hypothetical protein